MFEQTFKNIDDILHKDAGCTSELDYTEQSSWLLFLKYLDALEQDKAAEAELSDYLRSLPERHGCAMLMVSHDLHWVMQGTQRVVCLNRHICCTGSPQQVQQAPEYQALFGRHHVFYQHHHDHCQHEDEHHHACGPGET